jgi:hypothetical protein
MKRISRIALLVALAGGLPGSAAFAGHFGGGGGGSTGEGDFAVRAELQNPRFVEPGSPYGYYRSYARGPAYASSAAAGAALRSPSHAALSLRQPGLVSRAHAAVRCIAREFC